jgi:transketolase
MEMRAVFGAALDELMAQNPNIVVIDADLAKANGTLALREKYPERALDVGVAEQNMAGIAAGLASYGFVPFISSFTPFATRRIADQVAVSISYARQNVKIVGTDPGVSAEYNGGTHMSMEDVGIMRAIPGIVVFEPADAVQLRAAMPVLAAYDGPVYMRLFRKEAPAVFPPGYRFDLFRADLLRAGCDVTVAAGGIMAAEALAAADILEQEGVSAEVINFHTLKPLDETALLASVAKTGCAVTAENHSVVGGLGSAVADALAQNHPVPLGMVGVPDCFGMVGALQPLKEYYHLTAKDIAGQARRVLSRKKEEAL